MTTAIAFPGQGAQTVGMARKIGDKGQSLFAEASTILGWDLLALCNDGPAEKLGKTEYAQPALLTTSLAIWEDALRPQPQVFLGHSLGEVTAMVAAGCLSFADGVRLVAKRAELMGGCSAPGGMLAVLGLETEDVEALCQEVQAQGWIQIANHNSPGQIVVSGEPEALSLFQTRAAVHAKRVVPLDVSGPFHSRLMQQAAEEFYHFVEGMPIDDPRIPVVSNYRSILLTTAAQVREELVGQLTNEVHWIHNIELLESIGISELIEMSPKSVLIGLTKRITKSMQLTLAQPKGDIIT